MKNFFYARRTTDKRNDSRCYFGATAITGTETRRKSGEDKREFAELLLRDWLEFEGRRKQHTQKKNGVRGTQIRLSASRLPHPPAAAARIPPRA